MVSTPEGCTNNIPMTPNPYVSTKNTSAGKSLRQFSDILDVKQMTDVHGLCAAKEKCKKIKTGNFLDLGSVRISASFPVCVVFLDWFWFVEDSRVVCV